MTGSSSPEKISRWRDKPKQASRQATHGSPLPVWLRYLSSKQLASFRVSRQRALWRSGAFASHPPLGPGPGKRDSGARLVCVGGQEAITSRYRRAVVLYLKFWTSVVGER